MNVDVRVQDILAYKGDALIVNLFEGVTKPGGATAAVDQALGGLISQAIAQGEFQGKAGTHLLLHTQGKLKAERVLVAGLGKQTPPPPRMPAGRDDPPWDGGWGSRRCGGGSGHHRGGSPGALYLRPL